MHIALVDPSRVVQKSVSALLETGGHTVDAFANSEQALAFVTQRDSVSAVITSLEVQPMGGLELCWSLRTLAETRRPLAIIVMSSAHTQRSLGEVLDSGADDFIAKPPGAAELHARLRAAERVVSLQRELIRQADTDPLTRLLNRRAFFRTAGETVSRLGSEGVMSAMLVDIDHFKGVNDTHGHDVGDAVIAGVAAVLTEPGMIAGRLGGEEFAVLVPDQGLGIACVLAERLRQRCADLRFDSREGAVELTVSIGVSEWNEPDGIDALLKRADLALYAAKHRGRNRVVTAAGGITLDS